jgi:hypothetical protein
LAGGYSRDRDLVTAVKPALLVTKNVNRFGRRFPADCQISFLLSEIFAAESLQVSQGGALGS